MPPYAAPVPRLVIGILVLLLAVIFFFVGDMDPKLAALLGLAGVGLMSA
jgi:hypothetical protein